MTAGRKGEGGNPYRGGKVSTSVDCKRRYSKPSRMYKELIVI